VLKALLDVREIAACLDHARLVTRPDIAVATAFASRATEGSSLP
jgi:hypothetical protein